MRRRVEKAARYFATKSGGIVSTLPRQSSLSWPINLDLPSRLPQDDGARQGRNSSVKGGKGSRVGSTCPLLADELELSSHRCIPYRQAASLPSTMTTLPSDEIRDCASARMLIRGE